MAGLSNGFFSMVNVDEAATKAIENNNYHKAIDIYTQIVEHNSAHIPDIYLKRGQCHFQTGQFTDAIADANMCTVQNKDCIEAYILGGRSAVKIGKYDAALALYKSGLVIEPNNKEIADDLREFQKTIIRETNFKESETESSVVAICSQVPYPGDDQLLLLEQEILDVKYHITNVINSNATVVSPEKQQEALKSAMIAGQFSASRNIAEALKFYSLSIKIDPSNMHYKRKRAEMYGDLMNPSDALRDLYSIPKQIRNLEIWKMGGKLLRDIEMPVSAEFWFRKATKLSKDSDDEAAISFQQVRADRLYGLLCLDHSIRVEFTKYGKTVLATDALHTGDTVFRDIPIIFAQSLDTYHVATCCNCSRLLCTAKEYFGNDLNTLDQELKDLVELHWPIRNRYECEECKLEFYCNHVCRKEAWERYHSIICPKKNPSSMVLYDICKNNGYGIGQLGRREELWGGHFSPMILAKIWSSVVSEAKRLMLEAGTKTPTIEHWARAKAPLRRFIAVGQAKAVQKNPYLLDLLRSVFSDCGDGIKLDITEAEYNGRYYQATCNLQTFSSHESDNPYYGFLTNLATDFRSLKLLKILEDRKPPSAAFAGLFPLHACLNHSCYNNVEVHDLDIDGRPGIGIRAKREIRKGEELFSTYIDTKLPKLLRQAWLYRTFNFLCQCKRCEFEGDEPEQCTHCKSRGLDGIKYPGCGKCRRAWYCSVKCQKQAWVSGHKAICMEAHSVISEESKNAINVPFGTFSKSN